MALSSGKTTHQIKYSYAHLRANINANNTMLLLFLRANLCKFHMENEL